MVKINRFFKNKNKNKYKCNITYIYFSVPSMASLAALILHNKVVKKKNTPPQQTKFFLLNLLLPSCLSLKTREAMRLPLIYVPENYQVCSNTDVLTLGTRTHVSKNLCQQQELPAGLGRDKADLLIVALKSFSLGRF